MTVTPMLPPTAGIVGSSLHLASQGRPEAKHA